MVCEQQYVVRSYSEVSDGILLVWLDRAAENSGPLELSSRAHQSLITGCQAG
jgi:hypothetical protein